jgi:hypothetical protein
MAGLAEQHIKPYLLLLLAGPAGASVVVEKNANIVTISREQMVDLQDDYVQLQHAGYSLSLAKRAVTEVKDDR